MLPLWQLILNSQQSTSSACDSEITKLILSASCQYLSRKHTKCKDIEENMYSLCMKMAHFTNYNILNKIIFVFFYFCYVYVSSSRCENVKVQETREKMRNKTKCRLSKKKNSLNQQQKIVAAKQHLVTERKERCVLCKREDNVGWRIYRKKYPNKK